METVQLAPAEHVLLKYWIQLIYGLFDTPEEENNLTKQVLSLKMGIELSWLIN